jgi:anaerobic selenocysteine-containing dehydrogenase
MHPDDAAARGLNPGDSVDVSNERGSIRLHVAFTGRVTKGTVAASLGWNKLSADGNGINVLTSERLTDIGGGATFYATSVQVSRAVEATDTKETEVAHA